MKKYYLSICIFLLIGCATSQPKTFYMGYEVIKMPFKTAENKIIYLPVTDAGAVPAKKDGFTMKVAGFSINKSKTVKHQAEFVWNFAFYTTNKSKISSIKIEEIYANKSVEFIAKIDNPQVIDNSWRYNTNPVIANKTNFPWIYKDRARICLFRITIDLINGKKIVLHQPTWFATTTLVNFVKIIKSIQGS